MGVLPRKPAFLRESARYRSGVFSLVLSLEAVIIFSPLILGDSMGLTFLSLASRDLDHVILAIIGVVLGVFNFLLFNNRSTAVSRIVPAIVTGATILAAFSIVRPFPVEETTRLLGAALIFGAAVVTVCFQFRSIPRIFFASTKHVVSTFLAFVLSLMIVTQMWMMESMFPLLRFAGNRVFDTFNFIQGAWIRLYPYTIAIFALLMTHPLWMPILQKIDAASLQIDLGSIGIKESNSKRARTFQYWPLVTLAIATGVIVSSYRLQIGYPLTGDAHYYFSMLQQIDTAGIQSVLSTDRPLFFLVLASVRSCLSIESEQLLKYLQIFLTSIFVLSTYFFVNSCIKDETLAILSAFLASVSPQITIGIRYFIVANWLALIMMMVFYVGILRSLETKSRVWVSSSVILSWCIFGIHFPTWAFSILTLLTYMSISYFSKGFSEKITSARTYFSIKIAIGCLLALPLAITIGSAKPEISSSIQSALSKTMGILAGITPLNTIEFLQDNVLLSSYFGCGSYAIPLTYALALLGLFSFWSVRRAGTKLILCWAIVASSGLLLIPKLEHWRLLNMMPLDILAAAGLLYSLRSLGLLNGSFHFRRQILGTSAILAGTLFLGAILFFSSLPSLMVALALAILICFLARGLSIGQVCHIVAIKIMCLYLLANISLALCSLR